MMHQIAFGNVQKEAKEQEEEINTPPPPQVSISPTALALSPNLRQHGGRSSARSPQPGSNSRKSPNRSNHHNSSVDPLMSNEKKKSLVAVHRANFETKCYDYNGQDPKQTTLVFCEPTGAVGSEPAKNTYDSKGARPKALGIVPDTSPSQQPAPLSPPNKMDEDECEAKHRARSILASALPVSPVSSGPSTPSGSGKLPLIPNLPKGYMPITSTILTPINFRPPFVAHKRPSITKLTSESKKPISVVSSTAANFESLVNSRLSEINFISKANDSKKDCGEVKNKLANEKQNNSNENQHKSNEKLDPKILNEASLTISSPPLITSQATGNKSPNRPVPQQVLTTALSEITGPAANVVTAAIPSSSSSFSKVSDNAVVSSITSSVSSTPAMLSESSVPSSATSISSVSLPGTTISSATQSNTSSRSSSPGFSLTTFALNSEGRGIPGTLFFAIGSDKTKPSNTACPVSTSTIEIKSPNPGIKSPSPGVRSPPSGIKSPTTNIISHTPNIKSPTPNIKSPTPSIKSPTPNVKSPTPNIKSPTPNIKSPAPIIKSPTPDINMNNIKNYQEVEQNKQQTNQSKESKTSSSDDHWWSIDNAKTSFLGIGKSKKESNSSGSNLVNSTWVRLMGGSPHVNKSERTARAVSSQQLDKVRKSSQEEGVVSPRLSDSRSSSATIFTYPSQKSNSPSSSLMSSATNSNATSPLPFASPECQLKSIASKNISSAILSFGKPANISRDYVLAYNQQQMNCYNQMANNKPPANEVKRTNNPQNPPPKNQVMNSSNGMPGGVETMTCSDLVCPSCQMLFPPNKHINFLDHFEMCRGPEYADL